MKVIIAGSRTITGADVGERQGVFCRLHSTKFDVTEVVCGEARGIDTLGKAWAIANGIPVASFPADWKTHRKAAGPIRNKEMAAYADALILIWDGVSRGSANMLASAKAQGLLIEEHIIKQEE